MSDFPRKKNIVESDKFFCPTLFHVNGSTFFPIDQRGLSNSLTEPNRHEIVTLCRNLKQHFWKKLRKDKAGRNGSLYALEKRDNITSRRHWRVRSVKLYQSAEHELPMTKCQISDNKYDIFGLKGRNLCELKFYPLFEIQINWRISWFKFIISDKWPGFFSAI